LSVSSAYSRYDDLLYRDKDYAGEARYVFDLGALSVASGLRGWSASFVARAGRRWSASFVTRASEAT
jgi:hypothetical protein